VTQHWPHEPGFLRRSLLVAETADPMTMVVDVLLVALGLLVGPAMAFVYGRYMAWVRRHHPGPMVRVWRALFLVPLLLVMVASIQAAGVSASSVSDADRRRLVLLSFVVGFFGTPLVYWLRRRRRRCSSATASPTNRPSPTHRPQRTCARATWHFGG
jgi:drug/metabolite transporter (DMT)-like permease